MKDVLKIKRGARDKELFVKPAILDVLGRCGFATINDIRKQINDNHLTKLEWHTVERYVLELVKSGNVKVRESGKVRLYYVGDFKRAMVKRHKHNKLNISMQNI